MMKYHVIKKIYKSIQVDVLFVTLVNYLSQRCAFVLFQYVKAQGCMFAVTSVIHSRKIKVYSMHVKFIVGNMQCELILQTIHYIVLNMHIIHQCAARFTTAECYLGAVL